MVEKGLYERRNVYESDFDWGSSCRVLWVVNKTWKRYVQSIFHL